MASIVGELFRSDCFDPLATWWHIFHPTKVGYPTFVGYPTIEVGLPPDHTLWFGGGGGGGGEVYYLFCSRWLVRVPSKPISHSNGMGTIDAYIG